MGIKDSYIFNDTYMVINYFICNNLLSIMVIKNPI